MTWTYDHWKTTDPADRDYCDRCGAWGSECGCDEDLIEEPPEPATSAARADGCTCQMQPVNSASIDPPEPIIDEWCPLHGSRDPDREYDAQRDEEMKP